MYIISNIMKNAAKRQRAKSSGPTKLQKTLQATIQPFLPAASGTGTFPNPEIHIACWNINGVRAWIKKPNVLDFCTRKDLDILCFNETKIQNSHISELKSRFPQFPFQHWSCSTTKLGYSGTAILSKTDPISWGEGLKGHPEEGRITMAEFDTFYLLANYVPNSGTERFDYRIKKWDEDLRIYIQELQSRKPVVWVGDLNVINLDIDIHKLKGNEKYAGATPEERKSFKKTLDIGLTDSFRQLYPDLKKFSWYSARSKTSKAKNEGWRIDMCVISDTLVPRLKDSLIYDDVNGSDHHPVEIILKNSN